MFSTLVSATLLSAAFAIQAVRADFVIDTISLTQCAPAHITWNQATGPYNLAVVPVADPCNTVLADLGDHNGLSMTWYNVTVPAGTQVMLSLLDSSDEEAWSGAITVADGDSACLSGASSASESSSESSTSDAGSSTLVLTTSYPTNSKSSASEVATAVGAANAGTLGNASGAMSNVRLPAAATIFASLAAVAVVLAL